MEWMLLPLRRYAQFSGRSRRKEYWMFFLFLIIARIILVLVDGLAGLNFGGSGSGLLSAIFGLATFIPSLAVGFRRLHDTDRSGWWLFLALAAMIPGAVLMLVSMTIGIVVMVAGALLATILLLVFLCTDGTRGDNRFGPDPKGQDFGEIFA